MIFIGNEAHSGGRVMADREGTAAPAAGAVLALAAWYGLLVGTLHTVVLLVSRFAFGRLLFYSPWFTWLVPAAHVILFLCLAVPVALLGRIMSPSRVLPAAAGVFALLGVVDLLIPFPAIAWWAVLTLGAGVAVQAGRCTSRRSPLQDRRLRWSAAGMLAFLGLVGAVLWAAGAFRNGRGRVGEAGGTGTPNVVLVILDTVRGASTSLHGYARPTTPFLQRLAAEGTVFDRAHSTTSWTLPSHASILTGRPPGELGGGWLAPVHLGADNLPEIFAARGYRTGGFVANLLYTSRESGIGENFQHYDDYVLSFRLAALHVPLVQSDLFRAIGRARSRSALWRAVHHGRLAPGMVPGDDYRPAPSVTDAFLAWQREAPDRPFFALLNYFDAHGPYRAPEEFMARFRSGDPREKQRDRYDAAIAFLDSEVERLYRALQAEGVLDHTVFVVTSDHGDLFGEHGLTGHANALYLPLLQVPLLVRYPPRVPAGVRVSTPVSLLDLSRTVLELSGDSSGQVPGHSLSAAWREGAAPEYSPVVADLAPGRNVSPAQRNARTWLQSAVDLRYQYIRDGLGREELFDLLADPQERTDLSTRSDLRSVRERLQTVLDSVLPRAGRTPAP